MSHCYSVTLCHTSHHVTIHVYMQTLCHTLQCATIHVYTQTCYLQHRCLPLIFVTPMEINVTRLSDNALRGPHVFCITCSSSLYTLYIHIYTHTYPYIHIYIYIHTYIYTYTYYIYTIHFHTTIVCYPIQWNVDFSYIYIYILYILYIYHIYYIYTIRPLSLLTHMADIMYSR